MAKDKRISANDFLKLIEDENEHIKRDVDRSTFGFQPPTTVAPVEDTQAAVPHTDNTRKKVVRTGPTRPWQKETDNKLETKWQQTESKPLAKREQTSHKVTTKLQQTPHETSNKAPTNFPQSYNSDH